MRVSQRIHITACGSGNFLVIAYKELRRLEHAILERLADLDQRHNALWTESRINIENFFGIEIDDFAVEVAVLSMWIAKHQMNEEFKDKFGVDIPLIPLRETGQILAGNAARIDWNEVCPNNGTDEIYLIGNPPYGGSKRQKIEQKIDYEFVFGSRQFSKNLDYIALWFIKGADYISGSKAQLSFVSTNSVVQGEHVSLMFPMIFDMGIEISYGYASFKWENNAKRNAGVSVVVIGLRMPVNKPKYLFSEGVQRSVSNINGYLADADNLFVKTRRSRKVPDLPPMTFGSMPNPTEPFVFTESERQEIIHEFPDSDQFIRPFLGADEFIDGKTRYALWVDSEKVEEAMRIPVIAERFRRVESIRAASKRASTRKLAAVPHKFGEIRYKPTYSIIVPSVSSERREYIPLGFLGPDTVISNAAFAVYDAEPWLFALLTSRMHMVWVRAVGGKMKTDYRYSNTIVYNNFPVPNLSENNKAELTRLALRVLDVREYHSERTLAELYDPDKMPDNLRTAHEEVDVCVDNLYSARSFDSDDDRLSELFDRYKAVIEEGVNK